MTEPTYQHGPGDVPTDVVAHLSELLACASWRLRRAARTELEPLGLTFGQARALRLLDRADAPVRMGELAARLEVVPRSATTTVDALEAAGLVVRSPDPGDRRSVLVCPTAAGSALLARLGRARRAGAETLFARLDDEQRAKLLELLAILNRREPANVTEGSPT
ncbi:MAG TPA: MarR family transcriptional regulator [Thermoleophilia bacterium]|nr:MarR family transcriptional regulator [Thermoleophilia bacterium]